MPQSPVTPPGTSMFYANLSGISPMSSGELISPRRRPRRAASDENIPVTAKAGFSFGADPEGFLFKDGKPIPAAGIIPGTKQEPFKVKKGAVQVDGMAAEYNIDPATTYEEWEENHTSVIAELRGMLPEGVTLEFVPAVTFDPDLFDAAPDDAKELGCQPDFDAWSGGVNNPPNPDNPYTRCAGGHVHFGWTKDEDPCDLQHLLNCQDLVKQLDWMLGGWSVSHDPDTIRRTLYGKMGACRYKDYGVEYRVLSNFWVDDPKLRLQVWNRMNHAIHVMAETFLPDRAPRLEKTLRNLINQGVRDEEFDYLANYPIMTIDPSYRRI